jgi:hypothetical protein
MEIRNFDIGSKVALSLGISGIISNCVIDGKRFGSTPNDVHYDILVPIAETSAPNEPSYLTRFENIEERIIIPIALIDEYKKIVPK